MAKIIGYKTFEKENGEKFYCLIVQGGLEAVKSQQTGKTYFTARTVTVPTTFDEQVCSGLIGEKVNGVVKKVATAPYEYTIAETGEVVVLTHRYEFVSEEDDIIQENVIPLELVS
ncbi:hypothetical protein [Flavobacterium sp. 102]|uniref:hypothetical protein n=1 Tax=Flavobacterium sp. 102 TaxID=2135623 RepID=UPI000EB497C9|nr:hypothetical protein [Flavobacterium sp. 102]RKS01451.1 hypothetical protein C8C84_1111 [Flavobacterium sp. 102]